MTLPGQGLVQPSVLRLKSGNLLAFFRDRDARSANIPRPLCVIGRARALVTHRPPGRSGATSRGQSSTLRGC